MTITRTRGARTDASAIAPSRRSLSPRILPIIGIAIFALLWEFLPRSGIVGSESLPPLTTVLDVLFDQLMSSDFWIMLSSTLRTWAIGLTIASIAGIAVGILIGLTPTLQKATDSTVEFLRPIPSVALIPLVILVFGTGFESGIMLIVYAAFWQVLVQVVYGVRDVDPVALDTAKVYRLSRISRIRYIIWPTALPYIFTGLRLASAVALVLAVTAELVIGTPGLGADIANARTSGNLPVMYSLVLVAGILGLIINVGARAIEKRAMWWHASVRRAGKATR